MRKKNEYERLEMKRKKYMNKRIEKYLLMKAKFLENIKFKVLVNHQKKYSWSEIIGKCMEGVFQPYINYHVMM